MALKVSNLEGNEIADDYVRKAPSRGRWGETWDILKSNFGKLVLLNVLVLLTFVPGIGIVLYRSVYINSMGLQYPFNLAGLNYPAYTNINGLEEQIYLSADLLFYSLLIVAGFIASIGISGAAYCIRRLLNTQGQFSFKSFFHGIKVCYFNTVLPVTVFMIFLFASFIVGDWKDLVIAKGASSAGPLAAYSFTIIATVLVGVYCGWLFAVGVSFRLKIHQLFKNAFVLMIGSPVQTVFFAGFALLPVWLYLIGTAVSLVKIISYVVFIFIGFALILLVWLSFTQWVFDLYVTPNIKAAEEQARAKKTPKELAAEKEEDDKRTAMELLAAGRSELIGKPILPIADEACVKPLGATFSRADLGKVGTERGKLLKDVDAYEQEHKNDAVYAEYNKLFAEREKALQSGGKKGKKKKVSKDNLLK